MKLLVPVTLYCLFAVVFYLLEKNEKFRKLPYMARQIIIGLIFGGLSAFSSGFGVEILGTVANVRDAAPLCAGLIFGAPAGIISGFIGGIYRWFSVFWGGGMYTRLACTISTIFVGFAAAGLRKLMFDNKKPTWGYGVFITVVCEVVHMLMILMTNMDDSAYAFEFVKGATIPMILGNGIAVGVAIITVSLLSHEKLKRAKSSEGIAQTFQRWLLVLIVVAFALTGTFSYFLYDGMAKIETREVFTSSLNDAVKDIRGRSDKNLLEITRSIRDEYLANEGRSLEKLALKYNVTEINVIDSEGLIIKSTDSTIEGSFDMNSTDQSKEFMVLTKGQQELVQNYGPIGKDGVTMRKFAGVSLSDGGFIQVGYDAQRFRQALNDFVIDVTQNRHVGIGGFIAVCDDELRLMAHTDYNGKHISAIGLEPVEEMLSGKSASALYQTAIVSGDGSYNEEYLYAFTFAEGYCVIGAMPKAEAMLMRDASLYSSLFMQVIIFAALFVFIYFLIKRVIINNLQKINGTLSQITDGNLNVTVDVRSNAEFSSLSDDINSTVTTLKRYISEAAARIDKELEYAKAIQLSALPANYPDNENYAIFARMTAAKEVGGDFYDFYKLDDDHIAIVIADVSGKGIPAAMFMMTAKTIIKDLAERGLKVDEIFTQANEKLCENNDSGMFVTAWMGILELSTGLLSFANAGHNPPLVMRENGEFEYFRSRAGFVLAGISGVRYKATELTLDKGDRIFLYTDGVTEATDSDNQLYGEARLKGFINDNRDLSPEALLCEIKQDIDLFARGEDQFDDITMLILDYKKRGDVPVTEKVFQAKKETLGQVMEFFEQTLEAYDCGMKTSMALCVALEELFVNVASYAYGEGEGEVSFSLSLDEKSRNLTIVMRDKGVPFNPLERKDPDISLSADEREIGGLGIFIVKKTMDKVSYTYKGDENILTMIKKI